MPTLTLYDAVGAALTEEMRRDHHVIAFGEGIATKRHDLVAEFGALRVFATRRWPRASSPGPPQVPPRRVCARSSTCFSLRFSATRWMNS